MPKETLSMASPTTTSERSAEAGFTLAALLVILTVLAVVIAYSAPPMWSDVLRRDRDIETVWRMKQYARAIAEFQRVTHTMPTSLEQLGKQKPRVIRQLWTDPLTGQLDWQPILTGAPGPPVPTKPSTSTATDTTATTATTSTGEKTSTSATPSTPVTSTAKDGAFGAPFIGVRPNKTGQSYLVLNGADHYENWSYTTTDLTRDQGGAAAGPCVNPQCLPSTPANPPPPPKP
jgi:type II secretory pathway pseudopilin PulG